MPTTATATETARIDLRTTPEIKTLVQHAAVIAGATVSGFVLKTAIEAAHRLVGQQDVIPFRVVTGTRFCRHSKIRHNRRRPLSI